MTVEVNKLTKIYGEQKAVDNITFKVNKGEVVGFLGPNGAGKSTTMKIISCFTLPTSGSAFVNNFDILENPIDVRKQIGYLPENNPLYEDMYIKEYLQFIARIQGIKNQVSKKINDIIDLTGLVPEKHKKIGALSKGYRQRVGLAQALLHDPEVLLLDEPTSGLDPNQIVDIRNLITEIGKEKTVILSSHIMQEVQAMCNRVIIINKGKIVADDKTELLLKKSKNKNHINVLFKHPVEKEELMTIDQVSRVEKLGKQWLISSDNPDVQELIFNFAVSHNNIILEMTKEKENLEKVFQELTSDQTKK